MNTCAQCSAALPEHTGRGRRPKYCDKTCSRRAQKAAAKTRPGKPCTENECDRKVVARGLCSTHYNRKYQPDRHKKHALPCAWCGTTVVKQPRSEAVYGVVCSTMCRRHLQILAMRGETKASGAAMVHTPREARQDLRPRPSRRSRARWFAGQCQGCGEAFVSEHFEQTCSEACADMKRRADRQEHKHRRRALLRAAHVAAVNRYAIFRRDNWKCWLCQETCDRNADPQSDRAPSLDHIIPLANGGTHEPGNVQTAHRLCNALRSNRPTITDRTGERVAVLF